MSVVEGPSCLAMVYNDQSDREIRLYHVLISLLHTRMGTYMRESLSPVGQAKPEI